MTPRTAQRALLAALALLGTGPRLAADPAPTVVTDAEQLHRALRGAGPGTQVLLEPGTYTGGLHVVALRGARGRPVVVGARDPAHPPVLRGGANAIQLTDPQHVVLQDLVVAGQTGNGINVDDGGTPDSPAKDVVLRRLTVRDIGPEGNRDGVKLSGVVAFRVEECTVERWGSGGSAVDMVGCRDGTIQTCVFRHAPGSGGSGVQAKGGTRDVVVRRCRFEDAGSRAVNVGGSTGLEYFRPPLATWDGERFEAKDVVVEDSTFTGSQAPAAFVGVDGAIFRRNAIDTPGRWAFRILQETRAEGFVPCRRVRIEDNRISFRSDRWSEGGVNVGPGTDAASFTFARNAWTCTDAPRRTRDLVRLPVPEQDGRYPE
jgi:hypothetical protein